MRKDIHQVIIGDDKIGKPLTEEQRKKLMEFWEEFNPEGKCVFIGPIHPDPTFLEKLRKIRESNG